MTIRFGAIIPHYFLLILAFSLQTLTPVHAEANDAQSDECHVLLTPAPSLTQKVQQLKTMMNGLRSSDREFILRMMSTDATTIEGKDLILNQLLDTFGFTTEKHRLRALRRVVEAETRDRLTRLPLARQIMRRFGSLEKDFQTPAFLSDEIARLYSHLTSTEQQNVALANINSDFLPTWAVESLQQAFLKLGYSALSADFRIWHRVFHYKRPGFFVKNNSNETRFFGFRDPDYFQDYRQVPAVVKFVTYFRERSAETVSEMAPMTTETLLQLGQSDENEALDQTPTNVDATTGSDNTSPQTSNTTNSATNQTSNYAFTMESIDSNLRQLRELRVTLLNLAHRTEPTPAINSVNPPNLAAILESARRFKAFFESKSEHNFEREQALKVLELIILIKGNVMLVGPTGTSKTALTEQTLGRILDDETGTASFASLGFNQETVADDVLGPISMRQALDHDNYERRLEEGVTQKRFVLLDELDKARSKLYSVFYGIFNERVLRLGQRIVNLPVEVVVAAVNKFISQFYLDPKMSPQEVQPFLDRFDAVLLIPGDLEYVESIHRLVSATESTTTINLSDINALRALLPSLTVPDHVEKAVNWMFHNLKQDATARENESAVNYQQRLARREPVTAPHKSTRIFSPRNLAKTLRRYLPAVALQRWIHNPSEKLEIKIEDIEGLLPFLSMTGVSKESAQYFKTYSRDIHEQAQYDSLLMEMGAFETRHGELKNALQNSLIEIEGALAEQISILNKTNLDVTVYNMTLLKLVNIATHLHQDYLELPARNMELLPTHIAGRAQQGPLLEKLLQSLDRAIERTKQILNQAPTPVR